MVGRHIAGCTLPTMVGRHIGRYTTLIYTTRVCTPHIHHPGMYTLLHPGYTTVIHPVTPWVYHRYTPLLHPRYTLRFGRNEARSVPFSPWGLGGMRRVLSLFPWGLRGMRRVLSFFPWGLGGMRRVLSLLLWWEKGENEARSISPSLGETGGNEARAIFPSLWEMLITRRVLSAVFGRNRKDPARKRASHSSIKLIIPAVSAPFCVFLPACYPQCFR